MSVELPTSESTGFDGERPFVALVAIAKNEGSYLADWVHHHLLFGFDRISVWVNGTHDDSVRILERIAEADSRVSFRVADDLFARAVTGAGMFQHLAYEGLAEWARGIGASHIAFLDIDEYWTPRDFETPVARFLAAGVDVDVVSFPWYLDEPLSSRLPFSPPFSESQALIPNHHVKSVVRFSDRVEKFLTHTARVRDARRVLVDAPFAIVDAALQAEGSKISPEQIQGFKADLPAAFILHRLHRSQLEYVAILAKGLGQAGSDVVLKNNRDGYIATTGARLRFDVGPSAFEAYEASRVAFRSAARVDEHVFSSEVFAAISALGVIELVRSGTVDRDLAEKVMRGVDEERVIAQARSHGRDRAGSG